MDKTILEILNLLQNKSKKEAENTLNSLVEDMENNKEIDAFNNLKDAYDKKLTEEQLYRVMLAFACYIKLKSND